MKPLRICLDARLPSGMAGGIEQFVGGMTYGLAQLTDGDEEYLFLVHPEHAAWLKPYLGANSRFLFAAEEHQPASRKMLKKLPLLRSALHYISPFLFGASSYHVPKSDGVVEKEGVDLMHFLLQHGFVTSLPTIYHPHDLQHLHLPQYFTPRECMVRNLLFRGLCEQAKMVAVASWWGKQDLIRQYGLPEEKIQVIPLAPSNEPYAVPTASDFEATRAKYALPEAFIFYPAQTYAHKNHLGLLDALAFLRDTKGMVVPFVSSGRLNPYFETIQKRIRKLRLDTQVQFLNFVSPLELQCLYRLCRCVVVPTKFEAASFPIWDAFLVGAPVACSNVTSLPRQVGQDAVVFDPDDTRAIAAAVERVWTDPQLREKLVAGGRENVARFTWGRTARHFRAHYRRICGHALSDEDSNLLQAIPLL